jgi:RNA-directed DNA polymerase
VTIPKPGGGERELGVPTVTDRFLQQALSQVLTPIFEPTFSDRSFGFRPGRSAHQAVNAARRAIEAGRTWVVDVDLDRFFDRVQHDALMARVARRVDDRRILRLIRRYLDAGVMVGGVTVATTEGTPQGSPLSPLLANIMLDDLDHVLERRGLAFVRYADDLRVYVASERAATRVLEGVTVFVEQRLHLRVNQAKSGIAPATVRGLLGFGFLRHGGQVRVRLERKTKARLRARLRDLTDRHRSIAMPVRLALLNRFLGGWAAYFALADTPSVFDEVDEWLRRRLRQVRSEGVEAVRRAAPQPPGARHPVPRSRPLGVESEGLLAHGGFPSAPARPPEWVLDRPWPGAARSPCPPPPGALANRRMRTRTSGGVGGVGVTPTPTRFCDACRCGTPGVNRRARRSR